MTKKKRKYIQSEITQNFIENYAQYVYEGMPDNKEYNTIFLSMKDDDFVELLCKTLDVLKVLCKDDLVSSFLFDSVDTLRTRKGLDQRTMILLQKMLSLSSLNKTETTKENEIPKIRLIKSYYKNGSTKFIGVLSEIETLTIEDTEGNKLIDIF